MKTIPLETSCVRPKAHSYPIYNASCNVQEAVCLDKSSSPLPLYGSNYKAYNYNIISFRGQNPLMSAFVKRGDANGIYKFLCESKDISRGHVREFLDNILSNENLAKNFIEEITQDPRKSAQTVIDLTKKLGGRDEFRNWYFSSGGYREAFGRYTGNLYSNAQSPEELLKVRPNWKLSDIVETYGRTKKGDPIVGNFPQELGSHEKDFVNIMKELMSPSAQKTGTVITDKGKISYEILKDANDKKVCKLTTEEGKNFIIKVDKIYLDPTFSRLRANSIYNEAMLGYYLSANSCKDAPKFHFYDFFHNAAIFENIEGKELPMELNPIRMNQLTPDLLSLGISTNDTHMSNYIAVKDGFVNIDLGNAGFLDMLKPGDLAHTISLPNYTGLDFSNAYSGFDFVNFVKASQKAK